MLIFMGLGFIYQQLKIQKLFFNLNLAYETSPVSFKLVYTSYNLCLHRRGIHYAPEEEFSEAEISRQ